MFPPNAGVWGRRGPIQTILKLSSKNPSTLNTVAPWPPRPLNPARIEIPTDPTEIITLANAIHEKHVALAGDSPLGGIKWEQISPNITQAQTFDNDADRLRKESEQSREKRDNLVPELSDLVRGARDILSGTYRSELRRLEDFGFSVDDTPKSKPASQPAPGPVKA